MPDLWDVGEIVRPKRGLVRDYAIEPCSGEAERNAPGAIGLASSETTPWRRTSRGAKPTPISTRHARLGIEAARRSVDVSAVVADPTGTVELDEVRAEKPIAGGEVSLGDDDLAGGAVGLHAHDSSVLELTDVEPGVGGIPGDAPRLGEAFSAADWLDHLAVFVVRFQRVMRLFPVSATKKRRCWQNPRRCRVSPASGRRGAGPSQVLKQRPGGSVGDARRREQLRRTPATGSRRHRLRRPCRPPTSIPATPAARTTACCTVPRPRSACRLTTRPPAHHCPRVAALRPLS
jgi:hypothetical protein